MPTASSDDAREVATPVGAARVHVARARGRRRGTLVLGHGAGGGVEAADLVALARALPRQGITVVRVEQPWRVAGRRVAAPVATLDRAWTAVLADLALRGPVVVGGRSSGARVACRTAAATGAVGVVALAFPLYPPGRPDRSRLDELDTPAAAGVPLLVVQGTRDAFGGAADVPPAIGRTVVAVEAADHSFRLPKGGDRAAALAEVAATVAVWVLGWCGESTSAGLG